MKKSIKILIFLLLIILAVAIIVFIYYKTHFLKYMHTGGWESYQSRLFTKLSEYRDLEEYFENDDRKKYIDRKKYTREFFEKKNVVAFHVNSGSSMNDLKRIDVYKDGNKVICFVDVDWSGGFVQTADVTGDFVMVDVDKSVTEYEIIYENAYEYLIKNLLKKLGVINV